MRRPALLAGLLVASSFGCAELPRYTPVESVSYPDQNWTDAQRSWFYHTSQGTKLMPYAWFLALEQPQLSLTGAPPFAAPGHLARFGFIHDAMSPANPDGLPVGFAPGESFVEGTTLTEPVVGMTCAACHTGQIEYRGRGLRIDGGPAMTNTSAFQSQMGLALVLTHQSEPRFARFAARVLGAGNTPEAQTQLHDRLGRAFAAGQAEAGMAAALESLPGAAIRPAVAPYAASIKAPLNRAYAAAQAARTAGVRASPNPRSTVRPTMSPAEVSIRMGRPLLALMYRAMLKPSSSSSTTMRLELSMVPGSLRQKTA